MRLDPAGLLLALHEGALEKPMFDAFLKRLKAQTHASYVSLVFRTAEEEELVERTLCDVHAEPGRTSCGERLGGTWFASSRMREGRVYSLVDLFDCADPRLRTLRDDLLAPHGITGLRSVRVSDPGGIEAWLACCGGGEVGASAGAILAGLAPHVRAAIRNFVTLDRERFRSELTSQTPGRHNFGWFTLDARCRIVDCANVERLFGQTSLLRRGRDGRLIPAAPAIDREISLLVKRLSIGEEIEPCAFSLSRDPSVDLLIAPLPAAWLSAGTPAVAIAYVSGDRTSRADRHTQLANLFGLTRSEARLAWAMAGGRSIAESAADLGFTVETARNYSKRIYAKTGAAGQAALVRIVLTSVLAIM